MADYWRLGGVCKRKKHDCEARAKERRERQEAAARAAQEAAAPRPHAVARRGATGRAPPGSPRAQPAAQAAPPPASPHREQLQERIEAAKAENEKLRGQLQKADEARAENKKLRDQLLEAKVNFREANDGWGQENQRLTERLRTVRKEMSTEHNDELQRQRNTAADAANEQARKIRAEANQTKKSP